MELRPDLAAGLRESGAPVVVTGAGGWLGAAALAVLDAALGDEFGKRVLAFGAGAREVRLGSGRVVRVRGFEEVASLRTAPAWVLHFAFRTRGFAGEPGYVAANRRISETMRGYLGRSGALGVFLPSSGAVYGPRRVVAPDLAANPYGALKLEDEAAFGALAARLGFGCVVMRIFNLAGPYINNVENYALASILRDVLAGGPVRLRAARPVWRSYAYIGDVLNVAVRLMLEGGRPAVFDTAGAEVVEIGQLAGRVAAVLGRADLQVERPDWEGGAADWYVGEGAAFAAAAGGLMGLDEQIFETAAYLRQAALF